MPVESQCSLHQWDVADNTELLHALDGFKNLEDGFGVSFMSQDPRFARSLQ